MTKVLSALLVAAATSPLVVDSAIYLTDSSTEPSGGNWCIDIPGSAANGTAKCYGARGATCGGPESNFSYVDDLDLPAIQSDTVSSGFSQWEDPDWSPPCTTIDPTNAAEGFDQGVCLHVGRYEVGAKVISIIPCEEWGNQRFKYTTAGTFEITNPDIWGALFCLGMGSPISFDEDDEVYTRELVLMDCALADPALITWTVDPTPVNIFPDRVTINGTGLPTGMPEDGTMMPSMDVSSEATDITVAERQGADETTRADEKTPSAPAEETPAAEESSSTTAEILEAGTATADVSSAFVVSASKLLLTALSGLLFV